MPSEDNPFEGAPPARLDVDVCRTMPQQVEFRAGDDPGATDASPGTLVGHFSMFDNFYEINSWMEGNFVERIAPGAFKKTLQERKSGGETPIRVLLEHGFDPTVGDKPLGVPAVLEERNGGPYAEVPLFDTSYNRDLAPALQAGAYGQSFRFQVMVDEWVEPDADGFVRTGNPAWDQLPQRTIREVKVSEFGPTVFPANPAADAGLRSTTDEFYERVRSRDPKRFGEVLARTANIRTPAKPTTPPVEGTSEVEARAAEKKPDEPQKHSEALKSIPKTPERSAVVENETMTSEERTARQSEIRARMSEIDSEYNGAELPEEVRSEWDRISDEYDAHSRAIEADQARKERIRSLSDAQPNGGERSSRQAPSVRKSTDIYDLTAIRQQARSIDEMPALYRDAAMRAVEQARFPGAADRSAAQGNVERLLDTVDDEQGTLARRVLVTGSPVYQRAFGKALTSLSTHGLTAEEQRALSLGSDGAGGYAVPFQLDPTVILTSDGVVNPLRQVSRVVQITGKKWEGVSTTGTTVSRSAEAAQVDDNSPTFTQPSVGTTRVTGFVPFSTELEASWGALQSEITMVLDDAKATEEAGSFMSGNGTAPQPQGLLTALAAASGSVIPTAGDSAYAVADLYALDEDLPPRARARAVFMGSKAVYNKTRQFATTDGPSLWVRLGASTPPELIGYPAYEASEMGSDITSDYFLVLGDFSKFLIVDRVGMSVELVPHLFGANGRPTGQRGVLAIWDNACLVLDANSFRVLHGHTS